VGREDQIWQAGFKFRSCRNREKWS